MFGSVEYPKNDVKVEQSDRLCPNCNGELEVSDMVCPHCGHEISWNENEENPKDEDLVGGIIGIVLVLVVIFLAVVLIRYALGLK